VAAEAGDEAASAENAEVKETPAGEEQVALEESGEGEAADTDDTAEASGEELAESAPAESES
jgi:hypothetical protein